MSHHKLRHFYQIIGARIKASPSEIRDAYISSVKLYHPDNPTTGNHAKFLRLREAYEHIKDAPLKDTKMIRKTSAQVAHSYTKVTGLYK